MQSDLILKTAEVEKPRTTSIQVEEHHMIANPERQRESEKITVIRILKIDDSYIQI